jgi:hypothetical protein
MVPQPPAHNQHVSGATAGAGALAPGHRLLQIITGIIAQRGRVIRMGGHGDRAKWEILKAWCERSKWTILNQGAAGIPPVIRQHLLELRISKNKHINEELDKLLNS